MAAGKPVTFHWVQYDGMRGKVFWIYNDLFRQVGNPPRVPVSRSDCTHACFSGQAYHQGADYFYMVNDDILLVTQGWADSFTQVSSKALQNGRFVHTDPRRLTITQRCMRCHPGQPRMKPAIRQQFQKPGNPLSTGPPSVPYRSKLWRGRASRHSGQAQAPHVLCLPPPHPLRDFRCLLPPRVPKLVVRLLVFARLWPESNFLAQECSSAQYRFAFSHFYFHRPPISSCGRFPPFPRKSRRLDLNFFCVFVRRDRRQKVPCLLGGVRHAEGGGGGWEEKDIALLPLQGRRRHLEVRRVYFRPNGMKHHHIGINRSNLAFFVFVRESRWTVLDPSACAQTEHP